MGQIPCSLFFPSLFILQSPILHHAVPFLDSLSYNSLYASFSQLIPELLYSIKLRTFVVASELFFSTSQSFAYSYSKVLVAITCLQIIAQNWSLQFLLYSVLCSMWSCSSNSSLIVPCVCPVSIKCLDFIEFCELIFDFMTWMFLFDVLQMFDQFGPQNVLNTLRI
jgi:hypothetical protein